MRTLLHLVLVPAAFLVGCGSGAETESSVGDAHADLLESIFPPCDGVEMLYINSTPNPETGVTEAEMAFVVDRPLEVLRKIIDPQNWEACSPDYFKSSDSVMGASLEPVASPPATGSTWSGIIYEDVRFRFASVSLTKITNLLDITTESYPDDGTSDVLQRVSYSLRQSLVLKLGPKHFDEGVDVDEGSLEISPYGDGRWLMKATKNIHFELTSAAVSDGLNAVSPLLFKKVGTDLGWDLMCCDAALLE